MGDFVYFFFVPGQLCFLILSYIPQTKPHITAARKTYIKSFTHKGVISTLLGAFILGSGMAVGGAVSLVIIITPYVNAFYLLERVSHILYYN